MAKKTDPLKHGPDAFDHHYRGVYHDRWPRLRQALLEPARPADHLEGLVKPYYLDAASVRAARALEVQPGDEVLDLCAAPGGKTLVLALALAGSGRLVSNDRSADRRGRLRRVIEEHLPEPCRANITVTGHDAARWGLHETEAYDRVLLDAPCSSERHVINDPAALRDWSAHRTKALAQQALAMLCSALEAVKVGGTIVYGTCSISPEENEGLVARFASKRPGRFEVEDQVLVLPDDHAGEGPLFWVKMRRRS